MTEDMDLFTELQSDYQGLQKYVRRLEGDLEEWKDYAAELEENIRMSQKLIDVLIEEVTDLTLELEATKEEK